MKSRPHKSLSAEQIIKKARKAYKGRDSKQLEGYLGELGNRRSNAAKRAFERVKAWLEEVIVEVESATQTIFGEYEVLNKLPAGNMARAYQVRHMGTGDERFLKVVDKHDSSNFAAFQRELQIYERISRIYSPYVIQVIDFHDDDEMRALVTEFADGGTLRDYVLSKTDESLPNNEVKNIAIQLAEGLKVLHESQVVHRDVKPANIVKVGNVWKLVDFGISKVFVRPISNKTLQGYGTLGYAPPEQWDRNPAQPYQDIYALGKVITFMRTGSTDPDMLVNTPWRPLIFGCTDRIPESRPNLENILSMLRLAPG